MKFRLFIVLLCSFLSIKAQNWEWISNAPLINRNISNYLTDINFVDSNKVFLVGFDEILFVSKNGGDTWDSIKKIHSSFSSANRFQQISFADSLNGLWFIENTSAIYNTKNGGLNWFSPSLFSQAKFSFNSIVSHNGKFYVAAVDTLGTSHLFILDKDLGLRHHFVGDTFPHLSYNEVFLTKDNEIFYLQYQIKGFTKLFQLVEDTVFNYVASFPGKFFLSSLQKEESHIFLCNCFNSFIQGINSQPSSSFTLNLETNLLQIHSGSMLQSFMAIYFLNEKIGWRSTVNGLEETTDGGLTFTLKEPDIFITTFKEDKKGWLYGVGNSVYRINLKTISEIKDVKTSPLKLFYNQQKRTISVLSNDLSGNQISLKIFDGLGRVVFNKSIEDVELLVQGIDVSFLKNGFYVAQLSSLYFSDAFKIILQ